jgi:hypothetical protein
MVSPLYIPSDAYSLSEASTNALSGFIYQITLNKTFNPNIPFELLSLGLDLDVGAAEKKHENRNS